jgi:hypothetical protein
MRLLRLAFIVVSLGFVGCETTQSTSLPERPTLAEALDSVAGVYLCNLVNDKGKIRLYVVSVWKHEGRLGLVPSSGDELTAVRAPPRLDPAITRAVTFHYDPPQTRGGRIVPVRYAYVQGDQVSMFGLSVMEVEQEVRAAEAKG